MSGIATLPWLVAAARRRGDAEALRCGLRTSTWSQLAAETEIVASELSALGVGRGDILAVRMAPSARMVTLLHAAQWLGAALLPVNLRLAAPEVARILEHAAPRVFADAEGDAAPLPATTRRIHPFEDLGGAKARKSFRVPAAIDAAAALTVVYTSGTTSAPKGVVLTNASHAAAAATSAERLGHGEGDTWLGTLPLFHVGGLAILVRSVHDASRVILEPSFDADRALGILASGEATMVSMVPTMLLRVVEKLSVPCSPAVRAVLVGGAALSPSLGERALAAGLPVSATYGMTEACSQICTTRPGSREAAAGLVGLPLAGTRVRIESADADGWGSILVQGPGVMRGYLGNDDATAAALRDGWLYTGDLGRLDASGALAGAGRRDDLIVTGGENVAPVEVEQILDAHPDVRESLVAGVDDEEWGQRVVAVVVLRDDAAVSAAQLDEWCRTRLAAYKVPREFRFATALARGATGKMLRGIPDRPAIPS